MLWLVCALFLPLVLALFLPLPLLIGLRVGRVVGLSLVLLLGPYGLSFVVGLIVDPSFSFAAGLGDAN